MKIIVVVPAFNEEKVIASVMAKIPSRIKNHSVKMVVINDGSVDQTEKIVKSRRKLVISHPINRGLGAALATGFEYAKQRGFDVLVTLDGDGQHNPKEIERLIKPILQGNADFVVGTRIQKKQMPVIKRLLTMTASIVTFIFTGVWTTDSQSGFRAFSRKAIEQINITVDRMEVSSVFFHECKIKNLKIMEIPISTIYTRYSLKKGQSAWNSFNIVSRLALKRVLE